MSKRPWFPTVFSDRCDGCNGGYKCVDYCPNGVLVIKGDKAVVVNPLMCVDGCSTCASLCPEEAIRFPLKQTTSKPSKKSLLRGVVCLGCGKKFSTNRDVDFCFDCENRKIGTG